MDGDVIFLKTGNHEFLSLYTGAENAIGAVKIMCGRGFHPDWSDIQPIARWADRGWKEYSV